MLVSCSTDVMLVPYVLMLRRLVKPQTLTHHPIITLVSCRADVMLIPYVLMLRRLDATLDSLPNLKKYADTVKARRAWAAAISQAL